MPDNLSFAQFNQLMTQLAESWTEQKTENALDCFSEYAVYMEPPDVQLYLGHEQLRPYFSALTPGTYMTFHNLCFNETTQMGMGEYSFGSSNSDTADVGVAVVQIEKGKITHWREYQRKGPANFAEFSTHEGKEFEWHIGNYP